VGLGYTLRCALLPRTEEPTVFIPPPVERPTSPRVRELSQRIQKLLHDFQHEFPMTPAEVLV